MSLLNNSFIRFPGEPITGRVPTSVRILGSEKPTETTMALVDAAYEKFCQRINTSIAGVNTYSTVLSDGTRVRFISINGVDTILIRVGPDENPDKPSNQLFCVPYDKTFVDAQVVKTWAGAVGKNDPVTDIGKIKETKLTFTPGKKASHPGNLTWYAGVDGHMHQRYVLSWWGQFRRYVNESTFIERVMRHQPIQHYVDGAWGLNRRNDGYPNFYEDEKRNIFVPIELRKSPPGVEKSLTGAWSDYEGHAVGGDVGAAGRHAWLNGFRFEVPVDPHSMCIGRRQIGDKQVSVIRILSADMELSIFTLHEIPLRLVREGLRRGVKRFNGWETYTSPPVNDILPTNWEMWGCKHPAYWNADGNECTGVYYPRVPLIGTSPLSHLYSEGCAITFNVTDGSLAPRIRMNTRFTGSSSRNDFENPVSNDTQERVYASLTGGSHSEASMEGEMPLACDYVGNELMLLSYEIEGDASHNYDYFWEFEEENKSEMVTFSASIRYVGSWRQAYVQNPQSGSFDIVKADVAHMTLPKTKRVVTRSSESSGKFTGGYITRLVLNGTSIDTQTKSIQADSRNHSPEKKETWESYPEAGDGTSVLQLSVNRIISGHDAGLGEFADDWDMAFSISGLFNFGGLASYQYTPCHVRYTDTYSGFEVDSFNKLSVNVAGHNYRYEIFSGDLRTNIFTVAKYDTNISLLYGSNFFAESNGIVSGNGEVQFNHHEKQAPYERTKLDMFLHSPACEHGSGNVHPWEGEFTYPEEEYSASSSGEFKVCGKTGLWLYNNGGFSLIEPHSFNYLEKGYPLSLGGQGGDPQTIKWHRNGGTFEWTSGWFNMDLIPSIRIPENTTDNPLGGMLADGGAGDIKSAFASSASSPDGRLTYIHAVTTLGPDPTTFSTEGNHEMKFINYSQWFLDGAAVTPDKPYPQNDGESTGLSSPVIVAREMVPV
jgi:hypothetical protein